MYNLMTGEQSPVILLALWEIMYKYVLRRIYQLIIVFFLFLVTSYVLFDSIPGNAFQSLLLNPELPREAYDIVIQLYGLDKPLYEE